MTGYKIAVVVGSLRKDSINRRVAEALIKLAPADFSFHFPLIGDLPLYNQDEDATPAASVTRLKREIDGSAGVIFFTPEYNRSFSGVLKNALDHASRPYGQSVWNAKPAGVLGVSVGAIGTSMAQQHLRNVLSYLNMPTLMQPEAYIHFKDDLLTPSGDIGAASRKFLQGWMDAYVAWVKMHG